MTPVNPAWRNLKPADEMKTRSYPCNRWRMIYIKKGGGWRCLSCMMDFDLASAARRHHCAWETRWRSWSKREAPTSDTCANHLPPIKGAATFRWVAAPGGEIREIIVGGVDKAQVKEKSRWDRLFSFFRG